MADKIIETNKTKLIIGCGIQKPDDFYGIDINPRSKADLLYDLNKFPWPFNDNTFEEIYCPAIIEHLNDFYKVFEEIWRISKNGTKIYINVPHYSDTAAFTDPTHVQYLTTYSFDVLTKDTKWSYYTEAKFKIIKFDVKLLKLYKLLFIEKIINLSLSIRSLRFIQKLWGNYFVFIIRAKAMDLILEVKK